MDKELATQIEAYLSRAKHKNVEPSIKRMPKSSLERIIKTKEQSDFLMWQLKNLR